MANRSYVLSFLFISQLVMAIANASLYDIHPPVPPHDKHNQCRITLCESELKMELYLHDIHPPQPNHNLVISVPYNEPGYHGFGSITVNDWALLDAPSATAKLLGNAKGTGVNTDPVNGFIYQNSFSILFRDGSFTGSTLQVMGLNSVGEWAIVGGTGQLAFARGTIKYETVSNVPDVGYYLKLTIRALYIPPSATSILFP